MTGLGKAWQAIITQDTHRNTFSLADHRMMVPRLSSKHLVNQLTRCSRGFRLGRMCACGWYETRVSFWVLPHTWPCITACTRLYVWGYCGDCCSLNSVIVIYVVLASQQYLCNKILRLYIDRYIYKFIFVSFFVLLFLCLVLSIAYHCSLPLLQK